MKKTLIRILALCLITLPIASGIAAEHTGSLPLRILTPEIGAAAATHPGFTPTAAFRSPQLPAAAVAKAIAAQERHTEALLRHPGVLGTAVGLGEDGKPVVKVYLQESAAAGGLPATIDGTPITVEVIGRIYALNLSCEERSGAECTQTGSPSSSHAPGPREYQARPVPIGVSAGHVDVTAGTLACRVSRGCHNYALSNAHVFAAENAGQTGDAILQPGAYDGGIAPADAIGTLAESVPIIMTTIARNRVDAAIAIVGPGMVGNATPAAGYGVPRASTLNPGVALNVMKFGRTTSLTYGYIDAINATVVVTYRAGDARFVGQVIIRPTTGSDFSRPGDSGALVVASGGSDARRPVGLLFASGSGISVANPINDVLSQLDIDIDGEY